MTLSQIGALYSGMKNICIQCGKGFEGRKGALYDSVACRKKASRISVTLDEVDVTDNVTDKSVTIETKSTFTPNWKRLGFPDKETARMFVLTYLSQRASLITSKGLDEGATFIINGRTVVLTKKGFQEIDSVDFVPSLRKD